MTDFISRATATLASLPAVNVNLLLPLPIAACVANWHDNAETTTDTTQNACTANVGPNTACSEPEPSPISSGESLCDRLAARLRAHEALERGVIEAAVREREAEITLDYYVNTFHEGNPMTEAQDVEFQNAAGEYGECVEARGIAVDALIAFEKENK